MSDHDTPERGASRYPQIVRAVAETPWAILPGTLETIVEMIRHRLADERLSDEEIAARVGASPARKDVVRAGGVAVIPIYGVIAPKADLFSEISGGTSVQRLQSAFRDALDAKDVSAIVLEVDSPGGQVDLVPEFAAELRAARGKKPIIAVANTLAASAAYWLGSQADEFVVTPSGVVGSIGVFATHNDFSAAQEKAGVKTTLIKAGEFKVEGNPHEPLSDTARAHIQELVDDAYMTFTGDVAKGRRVSVDTVRSGFGQGRVLNAKAALKEGMVDRIDTLEGVVQGLTSSRSRNGSAARSIRVKIVGNSGDGLVAAGPLRVHKTATSDGAWDGPQAKANLRDGEDGAYYASAFAWRDDEADPGLKGSYKFIHHEVASNGDVGAANMTACSNGIAVLNGGRTGTTIPDADRQGVYDHLAKHLRDGGKEPPPLKSLSDSEAAESGLSFADAVEEALRAVEAVVSGAGTLRVLTGVKRHQLSGLIERANELLATQEETQAVPLGDELEVEFAIAAADDRLRGL